MYFGSKYDAALEMLVWEFISRLDELLPVPDFTQVKRFSELSPGWVGISSHKLTYLRSGFGGGGLKRSHTNPMQEKNSAKKKFQLE